MASIQVRNKPETRVCTCHHYRGMEFLLAGLNLETRTRLEQLIGRQKILQRGQKLFMAGEISDSLYLINSGSFKAFTDLDNGEEQITGFHFADDVLGFDGLEDEQHTYTVEALETSGICRLPLSALDELSGSDPKLYQRLLKKISRQIGNKHMTIIMLGRMNAEQRLAQFFLKLSSVMEECGCVSDRINLSMSRYDIANYLSLALETVCRLLSRFQNSGLLKVDNRRVQLLDREGLRHILRQDDEKMPPTVARDLVLP